MAKVEITFFTAGNRSIEGGTMPVPRMTGMISEVLTSGATSVATTQASAATSPTGFVRIQAAANIWVVAGANPVATVPAAGSSGPGVPVKANMPTDLAIAEGDRIAVVEG